MNYQLAVTMRVHYYLLPIAYDLCYLPSTVS